MKRQITIRLNAKGVSCFRELVSLRSLGDPTPIERYETMVYVLRRVNVKSL